MSILEQIKSAQLNARRVRDHEATSLLTTLLGDAAMVGKNNGNRDSTDSEVIAVIKKFINNAEETLKLISDEHQINKYRAEIAILKKFLPTQLDETELSNVISALIVENNFTNIKDMGKLMKVLKEKHDGTYNGSVASELVKQKLAG
jgi:uncharacterized protein YqeY